MTFLVALCIRFNRTAVAFTQLGNKPASLKQRASVGHERVPRKSPGVAPASGISQLVPLLRAIRSIRVCRLAVEAVGLIGQFRPPQSPLKSF